MLELRNISKSFGAARVLDSVSLDVLPGEVHALTGENGAGKSTLMNIVSGVLRPDQGEMLWDGRPVRLDGPRQAQALGIGFVHQELALVPQLSVGENVFLGRYPAVRGMVNFAEMYARTRRVLEQLGREIDPRRLVGELSLADRQIVEIARAVAFECRLVIMDEPTAPLSAHDAEGLFRTIRLLRSRGVSLIYISHRLKEIFDIADRVTVLRDGRHVFTRPAGEVSQEELVRAMVGAEMKQRLELSSSRQPSGEALRVEGAIRFAVRHGEIVGLAGLAGSGRTELLEWLFGAAAASARDSRAAVEGETVQMRSPADAQRRGMALVPDDRKSKGLVIGISVLENMTLAARRKHFFVRPAEERRKAQEYVASLRIKTAGLDQPVAHLSGGNQQKVVLARWLFANARIFLLDEPTRGIDVGAKAEIYDMIRTLAGEGAAVLMASSELEELLALADRIVVLHRGRMAGELTHAEATEEKIMHLATGGVD